MKTVEDDVRLKAAIISKMKRCHVISGVTYDVEGVSLFAAAGIGVIFESEADFFRQWFFSGCLAV